MLQLCLILINIKLYKAWSIVLLMFNPDHFDVNNTNNKISTVIS